MKSNNWRPVPWSLAMHANLFGLFIMGGLVWLMNGCPPSPPRQPPPRPVYPSTELIWSYETGGGVETTPALAGGVLYFGSSDHHVYALDAASGELVWRYQTGGPVFSSPAVAAGIVYVGSDDHHLYALDAASGEPLWKYETGVLRQRYGPGPQVRSTPVVAEGMVYFDSGDGNTYALDAATGDLRWHAAPGDVASSPQAMNGVVFVGAWDEHLYALDAATGETLWRYATNGDLSGRPTVQENVVYFSAVDWSSRDHFLRVYALQADTGEQLWSTRIVEGFGEVDYSPVPAGSVVYVSTYSGLYTLDTATGEILHTYQGYHLRSAPIVDEGVIYVGDLYALNAADGNIIWHYDLESGENSLAARTGFSVHPTPAKGGGVVYVGSLDGHLYALDASMRIPAQAAKQAPAEDPRPHRLLQAARREGFSQPISGVMPSEFPAPVQPLSTEKCTPAQATDSSISSMPPLETWTVDFIQTAAWGLRRSLSKIPSFSQPSTVTSTPWNRLPKHCSGDIRPAMRTAPLPSSPTA